MSAALKKVLGCFERHRQKPEKTAKDSNFNPVREMLDYGEEAGMWHYRGRPDSARRSTRPPSD